MTTPTIVRLARAFIAEHDTDAALDAGTALALAVLADAERERDLIIGAHEAAIERARARIAALRGEDVADACDVVS